MKLTVIFRDDSPMMFCNDSPSYRSILIELTPQQEEQLKPRYVGCSGATKYYEAISKCFIEPEDAPANQAEPVSNP
jgi:hypothetical protein